MPVAPELVPFLELVNSNQVSPGQLSVEDFRSQFDAMSAASAGSPEVETVESLTTNGGLNLRLYRPNKTAGTGVVYFHGGGFVLGSLDTHDNTCRHLALLTETVVISVEYRLAPEHPYPAAPIDCLAALNWVNENRLSLGLDNIFVAGDSAGGNLAAATVNKAKGSIDLSGQILIYPVTDLPRDRGSYVDNATGFLLTAEAMKWFWSLYYRDSGFSLESLDQPADAVVLRESHLSGSPPTLIITAEFDPLRDEGQDYAARLTSAGVETQLVDFDGMIHGFFGMADFLPRAIEAQELVGDFIARHS